MAVVNQWDGRKIMKLTQGARLMTAAFKMMTKSLVEHEKNVVKKQDEKLADAIFKDKPDIDKVEKILGHSCIRMDENGIHFDDHVNVRLIKNYAPAEFSIAMAEHDVGCIRMVNNNNGLTAILYSSYDEEKMAAALKSMEVALGASPVVSSEELEKLCKARGNSKVFEISNLSYADTRRFEYAASKNSINIAITKDESTSDKPSTYKVKVLSTDNEKVQKALRDVAVYKTKDGSDSLDRHFEQLEQAAEKAAEMAVKGETFYVCSASRPNSYIEVTDKGYNVMGQSGTSVTTAKSVEGKINDSKTFVELCEEMSSFESPVILSADEFSANPDERLQTVVGNMIALEQKNEGQAYVTDLTAKVLSAANACDYAVTGASSLTSNTLMFRVQKSDLPDKESVITAIEHLKHLPPNMINKAISSYRNNVASLENSISEATQEYEAQIEHSNDTPELDTIKNVSEEKE